MQERGKAIPADPAWLPASDLGPDLRGLLAMTTLTAEHHNYSTGLGQQSAGQPEMYLAMANVLVGADSLHLGSAQSAEIARPLMKTGPTADLPQEPDLLR